MNDTLKINDYCFIKVFHDRKIRVRFRMLEKRKKKKFVNLEIILFLL